MSDPTGRRLGAACFAIAACFALGLQPGSSAQAAIIGHWTFNDDTANDSSGNGNDGVPQGGFVYVDVAGNPENRGISLDGDNHAVTNNVGSGINFGSNALWNFLGNPFTFAAWFAVDTSVPQGNNEWIFGMSDSTWRIGYKADGGQNRAQVFVPGPSESDGGLLEPSLSFHHVLVSKEVAGSGYEWYLDGVAQPSGGGAAPVPDNSAAELQSGFGGGNALISIMDEFTLWDTALSAQEVAAVYAAGPTFTPSVVSSNVVFGNAFATEFISQPGITYKLECTTNLVTSNGWAATGAFVDGNGTNMFLFDPSGFSTAKLYRVSIEP